MAGEELSRKGPEDTGDNRLSMSQQRALADKTANLNLGGIKHRIAKLLKEVVLPPLEYCVQFWPPQYKKEVKIPEIIHKRGTKLVTGPESTSCGERLKKDI